MLQPEFVGMFVTVVVVVAVVTDAGCRAILRHQLRARWRRHLDTAAAAGQRSRGLPADDERRSRVLDACNELLEMARRRVDLGVHPTSDRAIRRERARLEVAARRIVWDVRDTVGAVESSSPAPELLESDRVVGVVG